MQKKTAINFNYYPLIVLCELLIYEILFSNIYVTSKFFYIVEDNDIYNVIHKYIAFYFFFHFIQDIIIY